MRYQRPKGSADILPGESAQWEAVEKLAREIFARYGYREIRTPIFENYNIFARSAGETSDVVTKEMYDFKDKGDRPMLKTSCTALNTTSLTRSTTWDQCFAMSGRSLVGSVSSTRSGLKHSAATIQPLTLKL